MSFDAAALVAAAYGEPPAKVEAAGARYRLDEVTRLTDFDAGYRLLDAQFGPVNEIERREILERWFTEGSLAPSDARLRPNYHMVLARDDTGAIAGARDLFTVVDAAADRVVVLLSHSLVTPEHRRSGLAALLRAVPVLLARRDAEAAGCGRARILLVAEMEPVEPAATPSVVRHLSYARAGFGVVPPALAPYAQPDFRDLVALGVEAVPIPMMLVVRAVGAETRGALAWPDLEGIIDSLGAIHASSVHPAQLPVIRAQTLRYRPADDTPEIPLLCAKNALDLAPLLRSLVLPHHPAAWHAHGAPPTAIEQQQLVTLWGDT